jgi:hypothetical protein
MPPDWLFSLWPRSSSLWPLLTWWSPLLASSIKLPPLTLQHLQQHLHALPRKCVEWQWTFTRNNLQPQLEVMENQSLQGQGYTPLFFLLSGSRFLSDNSNLINDTYSHCQSKNQLCQNIMTLYLHCEINNPKEYISKWPLQGLLSLLRTRKSVRQKTGAGGYLFLCPYSRHSPFTARKFQQEIQQWKSHLAIWSTELYYFSLL